MSTTDTKAYANDFIRMTWSVLSEVINQPLAFLAFSNTQKENHTPCGLCAGCAIPTNNDCLSFNLNKQERINFMQLTCSTIIILCHSLPCQNLVCVTQSPSHLLPMCVATCVVVGRSCWCPWPLVQWWRVGSDGGNSLDSFLIFILTTTTTTTHSQQVLRLVHYEKKTKHDKDWFHNSNNGSNSNNRTTTLLDNDPTELSQSVGRSLLGSLSH